MDKQGTLLKKYGLSYGSIAIAIGKSKTHVHGVLKGEREDPYTSALIRKLFTEKGMLQKEITTFPLMGRGENMSLQTLIEKDAFKVSVNSSKEIFESESFKLALSIMKEGIELRKFVAIIGETGSGKTNLVRYLEEITSLDSSKIICTLQCHDFDKIKQRQIYEAILYDISDEGPKRSTEALIRQVRQKLKSLYKEGKKVVLVVDESHHINKTVLLALKDVWESSFGFAKLISIILLGQDSLGEKLDEPKLREVDSRIERVLLRSISSKEELKEYIKRLCKQSGVDASSIIEDGAYPEVIVRTKSFIGINQLLKEAVELTLHARLKTITAASFSSI